MTGDGLDRREDGGDAEGVAVRRLEEQGFTSYLPKIRERRVLGTGPRVVERLAVLFPSYVFVGAVERWQAILRTVAIVDVLRSGDHPAQLSDAVIERVRAKEVDGLVALPAPPRLKRGEPCRITHPGSLFNRIGLYAGMRGRERERVLLDMLGGFVALDLPRGALVAMR